MTRTRSLIERTFRALLKFYPADFQNEFRDEMLEVAMACWKEKRMSGFVEKCLAFLKEAAGLLVLAPREWIRVSLKRPLSPVRAGLWCALVFATGVLAYRLIESAIDPLVGTSFMLYLVATLPLRMAFYALIGLVTGLLLKASRIGPLVVAWILGSAASYGISIAITMLLRDSLDILTVSGQVIRSTPANAFLGVFVGFGFRQVQLGGRKPRFPVLKSMLAFVAASPIAMLMGTLSYPQYERMGVPLTLICLYAIIFASCLLAGGLLGALLVLGRPNLAQEGMA
jgi:hypothetical protein